MPLLVCLADNDLQASSAFGARVAAQARNVVIRHFPLGHFDVYVGAAFEEISELQADFLSLHLRVAVGSSGREKTEPQVARS
jgi:hypothetical protein